MSLLDFFRDIAHNRRLYKEGKANRNEVRYTTIGWRPDPWNGEDGFSPDPGNSRIRCDQNGNEEFDTPSGNREYYRVVRSSSKKRR